MALNDDKMELLYDHNDDSPLSEIEEDVFGVPAILPQADAAESSTSDSSTYECDSADGTIIWAQSANDYFKCDGNLSTPSRQSSDFDEDEDGEYEEEVLDNNVPSTRADSSNPLAQMLPQEYRDVDVHKLFPSFRYGKPLRFTRLFGPGKLSKNVPHGLKQPSAEQSVVTTGEDTDHVASSSKEPFSLIFAPTPPPEECLPDDELMQLKPQELRVGNRRKNKDPADSAANIPAWRFGPAAYWYDQMGVSETGEGFDYGFKLKTVDAAAQKTEPVSDVADIPEESFLMFNQVRWEDDIIYDGEQIRQEVLEKLTSGKLPLCGWIPTQITRTYDSFIKAMQSGAFANLFGPPASTDKTTTTALAAENLLQVSRFAASSKLEPGEEPGPGFCILPPDNLEFINSKWEDEIIYDSSAMTFIPTPKVLQLDWNELPENRLPEDRPKAAVDIEEKEAAQQTPTKGEPKKKSQLIIGKVTSRQKEDEVVVQVGATDRDPFNLSNDEYYLPKSLASTVGTFSKSLLQHSIPAQNIMQPFFPTHLSVFKLRHFYRMPLKRYTKGVVSRPGFVGVMPLERYSQNKQKLRDQERLASGGGDMFFMRGPEDISARDGEIILCEFSEEHPPLMQQPGMASKIKNYYKRKPGNDNEPKLDYGETAYTHTSPFLGALLPGESLQALENNLYRAPIYPHQMKSTDFLIIRTRNSYFIRSVKTLFCVGQESPLYEVPQPNSKRSANFARDFLLVFIYRLFYASDSRAKKLRMEDIRKAFPQYAESSIRKRLKACADFKRLGAGPETTYWILRDDFRIPTEDELRTLITPEACCAFYSMSVTEQRLKDAGYGEKYFFVMKDNEDEEDDQVKMEDEIKCAPWNTTRAYLNAVKSKCLLDINGPADPTGCGEGFSYVRVSLKPQKQPPLPQEESQPKRSVTGTDADLRKLSLNNAKSLLKEFGVKDEEINQLTRWEIIDVIRTLSTQQARSGGAGITKFARGSARFSASEMQHKYKSECQRIFELQNKILRNEESLSTDDESSAAEDSDIEEMGKNIENMLSKSVSTGKKKLSCLERLNHDEEEEERKELQRMLLGGEKLDSAGPGPSREQKRSLGSDDDMDDNGRVLVIYRTFRSSEGKQFVREEEVRNPQLIDAYLKLRQTKDDSFIRQFAHEDDQFREEKRREKRRLQDQLRRLKRNEVKTKMGATTTGRPKKIVVEKSPPPVKPSLLKMKCSACGATGHMRTNKHCPLYAQTQLPLSQPVAPTDEALAEKFDLSAETAVSVEGTKLRLPKHFLAKTEKIRREALILKFPKQALKHSLKRPMTGGPSVKETTATVEPSGDVNEPSTSGVVSTSRVVPRPRLEQQSPRHSLQKFTKQQKQAQKLQAEQQLRAKQQLEKRKAEMEYLQKPKPDIKSLGTESASERRSRADPRVNMASVLEEILSNLKELPGVDHFLLPVNKKQVQDYQQVVKRPMDLQKIRMNLSKSKYSTREEFLRDIKLIVDNSALYNGPNHSITESARFLFDQAISRVNEKENKLMRLEKAINPLLDDNDLVAFSFILSNIIDELKRIPKSFAFHVPVDKKKFKDYLTKIKTPIDLGTMEKKARQRQYHSVDSFLKDVELLFKNSEQYNGPASQYTEKAKEIRDTARRLIEENFIQLADLERNIAEVKEKALEAVETDSTTTGISFPGETSHEADDPSLILSRAFSAAFQSSPGASRSSFVDNESSVRGSVLKDDLRVSGDEDEPSTSFEGINQSSRFDSSFNASDLDRNLSMSEIADENVNYSDGDNESVNSYDFGSAKDPVSRSKIGLTGQLHNDLAMSDSDASDSDDDAADGEPSAKRRRQLTLEEQGGFDF